MVDAKKRLGELLVEMKIVTENDINRALKHQEQYGGKIGQSLVALNILSEDKLLATLRYHFGLPVVDLINTNITPRILNLISSEMAERYIAIPIKIEETKKGKTLMMVMSNPLDLNAIEELQFAAGYKVSPVIAKESDIQAALNKYYNPKGRETDAASVSVGEKPKVDEMTIIQGGEEIRVKEEKKPPPPSKPPEKPPQQRDGAINYESSLRERKMWRALVRLLVEKEYITMKELEDMLKKD